MQIRLLWELGRSFHRLAAGAMKLGSTRRIGRPAVIADRPPFSHTGERRYPFISQAVTDEGLARVASVDPGLRRDDVLYFIRSRQFDIAQLDI